MDRSPGALYSVSLAGPSIRALAERAREETEGVNTLRYEIVLAMRGRAAAYAFLL
jgi:hypothetical protein